MTNYFFVRKLLMPKISGMRCYYKKNFRMLNICIFFNKKVLPFATKAII